MRTRWTHLCGGNSGSTTVDALYDVVEAMYRRPGHHTLRHVAECLDLFAEVGNPPSSEGMEFAILLHDIVYVPGRTDNEERSLIIANMMLQELGKGWLVKPVWELIRATTHTRPTETEPEALMADIDLSILGSDPARYDEYAWHIRQEFSSVADELYRAARKDVLWGFLKRERIFSTSIMEGRFETQARENMGREVTALAHACNRP